MQRIVLPERNVDSVSENHVQERYTFPSTFHLSYTISI